jgi:mono/diheme cytochrome c family protein
MRYTRIGLASYLLGALLLVAALAVAWVRSTASTPAPRVAPGVAETGAERRALGASVYAAECASCHGEGERRGRSIPPLRGFAVELFASAGGREYLIDLLLDGRVRRIEAGRVTFEPAHPDYGHLGDDEAAALLEHMMRSWGNEELLPADASPYAPAEIAARRPG